MFIIHQYCTSSQRNMVSRKRNYCSTQYPNLVNLPVKNGEGEKAVSAEMAETDHDNKHQICDEQNHVV